MRIKLLLTIIVTFLFLASFPTMVSAKSTVSIDGNFSDWKDKPSVVSQMPDSLALSKYDLDDSNLNFFYEGAHTYTPSKIYFNNYIDTEFGTMRVSVNYNYKAEKADVVLYNSNGEQVWNSTYRSGNYKKADNRQLEFSIPINYLVSSPQSGYNLNIHSDDGTVKNPTTIATASTLPFKYPFAILALCFISWNLFVKSPNKLRSIPI